MSKQSAASGGQDAFPSSKRGAGMSSILAVGLLLIGALLLFQRHARTSIGGVPTITVPVRHTSQQIGPLVPESQWGRWYKGDLGQAFPSTTHPFASGQTIIVPNYVSIRVDSVERNWTPQPWQVSAYPAGYQDDATGKEVILVRFTIQNLSKTPVMYLNSYFSLVRATGHEQRVAALDELTGDQYGSFGQTPWLEPGAMVHTFVPFLVNRGEQPQQFVLTWKTIDPTKSIRNGNETLPSYLNIARIPIALSASTAPGSSVTFVPDTTFTVTAADVYSTTPHLPTH